VNSRGRREEEKCDSMCLVATRRPIFIGRKQAVGGVRKVCKHGDIMVGNQG